MNNRFNLKWRRVIFQTIVVMVLLTGCGGGSSGGDDASGSSDVSLSRLTLDGIALDQTFQADRLNYSASVDFSQDSFTLTPVAADTGATILVNDVEVASGSASAAIALAVGQNLIDIVVTSEDGSATETYTLYVLRATASSDASLTGLTLSGLTLDQVIQPSQTAYSASVGFLQASVTLTPVAADDGATIQVNDTVVTSGSASAPIALVEGQNTISLAVTAEDGVTTQRYSIEISREDASFFAQQAYLKANNADGDDWYGTSVAISGDTLVVGAKGKDNNTSGGEEDFSNEDAGAAYVFTRNGGVWTQQAYLKASNAEGRGEGRPFIGEYLLFDQGDAFGASVAISGDTIAVGAPNEDSSASGGEDDNSATYAGAVYVFTRSDGVWSQQAYIKASNAEEGDRFGTSVAISTDTLVVGAPGEDSSPKAGEDSNMSEDSGAAYVFTRSGEDWSQQAYLKAKNPSEDPIWLDAKDQFGLSVAISGDTLVVGAPYEDSNTNGGADDNSALEAGAAYVFTRNNGAWSRQADLKASNAESVDRFGTSVAISGDTLVVGAPGEASDATGGEHDNSAILAGATYVFNRSEGAWSQKAFIKASNAEAGDLFGVNVSIAGDSLVVGASGEDASATGGEADNSSLEAGAAYVFTRNDGVWSQLAYIKASNAEADDQFGDSVAIAGDTLVVGAQGEDASATGDELDNSAIDAGAAYIWQ